MRTPIQSELIIALYNLKRTYPTPVDAYTEAEIGFNSKTGKNTVLRSKIHIKRAILLPSNIQQDFKLLVRYFQTGGFFTIDDRSLIIDSKEVPKGFDVEKVDYFVIEHKRYEAKKRTVFDGHLGWFVIIRELSDATPQEIYEEKLVDQLTLGESYVTL